MTYFELFDIPIRLRVDRNALSKKYFELSRQYHPDYYAQKALTEQAEALEISAKLNKAYKTFQDNDETIRYVLKLKGLLEEEEKYELPPDFLMEVLEINEQLMDGDSRQSAVDSLQSAVIKLEKEIYEPVKNIVEGYKEGVTTEEELLQVKKYYFQKKYLDRIKRQLAGNE